VIQKSIVEYLSYHSNVAWVERMNVGCHLINENNSRRYIRYAFVGCSDILGQLKNGQLLAIEVKSATGVLSESQREFINKVNTNGGVAFVARSIDDVEINLKKCCKI